MAILAAVQVRQKVPHKRTFLFLEQVILKHGAHQDTVNIKEASNGLDFYFSARNSAEKMVEFLHSIVPCTSVSPLSSDPDLALLIHIRLQVEEIRRAHQYGYSYFLTFIQILVLSSCRYFLNI